MSTTSPSHIKHTHPSILHPLSTQTPPPPTTAHHRPSPPLSLPPKYHQRTTIPPIHPPPTSHSHHTLHTPPHPSLPSSPSPPLNSPNPHTTLRDCGREVDPPPATPTKLSIARMCRGGARQGREGLGAVRAVQQGACWCKLVQGEASVVGLVEWGGEGGLGV